MRYNGVALVFQSLALVFAVVALCLYGYRYHHDRMWYLNVAEKRHEVFFPVLQDVYSKSSINWIEVYPGGLWDGHYARELPYSKSVETFLRWPLPQTSILLVVLVFLVLAELIQLIITGAMKCNYCTPPCHEKGFWHLLVGIVALIAVMIDILTYLQVQALYTSFGNSNSGNHSEGYSALRSCEGDSKDMDTDARVARDESNACPLFTFFVCDAIFTILAALCCFVATIALCIAWKRGLNDNDGVTPTESENLGSDGKSRSMSTSSRNEEDVNASVSMPFDYDSTEERLGSSETLSELVGEDGHREYFDGASQLESNLRPINGSSNRSSYYEENNLANNEGTYEESYAEIPREFYESSQKGYYGETQGESYEEISGVGSQHFQPVTFGHSDVPALSPVELGELKQANASLSKRDVDTQLDFSDLDQTYGKLRGIIVDKHNVLWPTNSEFTVLNAEKKIEEYVQKCWKIQSPWCFHIQFLQSMPGCYRNKFIFQVIFSVPTKEKPVPSATVSVYFTFDVDVYGGKDETVKVHYIIEGNRFPHVPGTVPFSQKWLLRVLEQKKKIQSLVCSQVLLKAAVR